MTRPNKAMTVAAPCPTNDASRPTAWPITMPRGRHVPRADAGLLLAVVTLLSGCGKSIGERRTEVVRCSGYIQAIQLAAFTDKPVVSFLTAMTPMSVGRPSFDAAKINAVARLGDQLAPGLDQVRVTAAVADGAKQWAANYGAKDPKAVLDFLDACIVNYDELLKAAR